MAILMGKPEFYEHHNNDKNNKMKFKTHEK